MTDEKCGVGRMSWNDEMSPCNGHATESYATDKGDEMPLCGLHHSKILDKWRIEEVYHGSPVKCDFDGCGRDDVAQYVYMTVWDEWLLCAEHQHYISTLLALQDEDETTPDDVAWGVRQIGQSNREG